MTTTETTPFRAFLARRDAVTAMVWAAISRLPLYLTSLALVTAGREAGETFIQAGLVLAAYGIGGAVVGPAVARRMDRSGQAVPLVATSLVHVGALGTLALARPDVAPACVLAFLGGGTIPPVAAAVRALWGTADLGGEPARQGAYALEAILGEVFVIVGPLVLSLLLVLADARAALLAGGLVAAAGAVGLSRTRISRAWRPAGDAARSLLGPLGSVPFVLLVAVLAVVAVATGAFNLLIPAFAEAHGGPAWTGVLFGVWGAGSVLGGLWWGRRRAPDAPVPVQFTVGLALVVAGLVLAALAWDGPSMALALVAGGCVIAPVTAVEYALIQQSSPAHHLGEAFTWVMSANVAGSALGAQVAGLVSDGLGVRAGFAVAAAAGVLAVAVAAAALPRWRAAAALQEEL